MNQEVQSRYIAVNEKVNTAGAIVWWRLSGDTSYNKLSKKWEERGLPEFWLMGPTTPTLALRLAATELQNDYILMRPLASRKGFAIVREQQDIVQASVSHTVIATVLLNEDDKPVVDGKIPYEDLYTNEQWILNSFEGAWLKHCQQVCPRSLSSMVTTILNDRLGSVGLRDRGGIYFVPNESLPQFDKMKKCLEETGSNKFFSIPAMASEDAVEAILDAVEGEAQQLSDNIMKGINNGMGASALKNRRQKLTEMSGKMSWYEGFLGKKSNKFPELHKKIDAGISLALLSIGAD